jgi:hypothetical protein
MKYTHHQLEYAIDDKWLREAGVEDFKPSRESYRSQSAAPSDAQIFAVPITSVEPLTERSKQRGIFCDDKNTGESAKQRVLRILRWFLSDHEVEPVKVVKSKDPRYEFRLIEGCHRFYCANAMGFKAVPATMGFDINEPHA